jgi:hypothetical protein
MVRHPEGAWLLYDDWTGQSGGTQSAVRLDDKGAVVVGPLALSPSSSAIVADALDGGLVFAAMHADEPELTVGVSDDQGNTIASAPLTVPPDLAGWEFQIAFDEETRQALVAILDWQDATANFNDGIHVARFTCE